jgi:hypothetical protein
VTRRLLALLVVLALALPALALADHTDPKQQINPADQRKAASILLKRTDFGAGWKKSPKAPDTNEHSNCPGYNPDQSDLVLTGEGEASFEPAGGIPSVSSIANIYRTRREAQAAWRRSAKLGLAPCFALILKREIEKDGGKLAIIKKGTIAFPRYAPRGVAYRVGINITVTVSGKPTVVPLAMHLIALGSGRGDSILLTFGLGDGVPNAELRRYAKLTATRLAAAKL